MRHHLRVPEPSGPPLTGHLPFADAPGVPDPIEVTSRYLTRGGRPWFPVSGEFHYSRYPAGEWEEELLKMKAGGITVVASYVIWIHHEEIEGRVRFDGDRDLRRFAELCARHGLDFIPRIGPWVHAEVRNGGLPDWVSARDCVPRTDDPVYLEAVGGWFTAIAEQLRGLDRAHGGPIVAVQIENELYDQPGHLLTLKRMAQELGLSAPCGRRPPGAESDSRPTNCFRCTAATPRPSGPRPTAAGPTPAASTSSSPTSATTRASDPTCAR